MKWFDGRAGDVGLMSASSNVVKNVSIFVRCAFPIDQRFQLAMRWARVGGKTLYNGVEPGLWGGGEERRCWRGVPAEMFAGRCCLALC
jgi:hypothetical protein